MASTPDQPATREDTNAIMLFLAHMDEKLDEIKWAVVEGDDEEEEDS